MMALGIDRAVHLVTDGGEWDPQATAAGNRRRDPKRARATRPDPVRQRVSRRGQLPGRDPRRAQARAPGRHRRQGHHRRRRALPVRAGGRGRARRVRRARAGGRHRQGGAEPAALPVGARPPARQAQAARRRDPGATGAEARDGQAHPPAGLGQAGRGARATAPARRPRSSPSSTIWGSCDDPRLRRPLRRRAVPAGADVRRNPRRRRCPRGRHRRSRRLFPRRLGHRNSERNHRTRADDSRRPGHRARQRGTRTRRRDPRPAVRRELHRGDARRPAHADARAVGREPARGGAPARLAGAAHGRPARRRRRPGLPTPSIELVPAAADRERQGVRARRDRRPPACRWPMPTWSSQAGAASGRPRASP